ncbi:MAG: hypothetical protein HYZ42_04055 [Bacteroidetes bacterium]|nr:hypothetical protein [Bacteroidota bacterium]
MNIYKSKLILLLFSVCVLFTLQQCNYKHPVPPETVVMPYSIDGLWINSGYIDSLKSNQSAKFSFSHKLTEVYIDFGKNYAYVMDGDWEPKSYRVMKSNDSIYIYDRSIDSSLKIKIYNNKLIATNDSGYIYQLQRPDTADIIKGFDFTTALRKTANQVLLAGKWRVIFGPHELYRKEILFNKDGSMSGLNELSNFYEICLTGECKRYCDETDIIYMSPKANEPGGYWHCFKREGNKLTIWKIKSLEWMSDWPDLQPETKWLEMVLVP